MKVIPLIIESSTKTEVWGRVYYDDNLIVDNAATLPLLEKRIKKLLKSFHSLEAKDIEFDVQYDITGLFEEKSFLNASVIAERAGINKSLLRQYVSGIKHPSFDRVKQIEKVTHSIVKELVSVTLAAPGRI